MAQPPVPPNIALETLSLTDSARAVLRTIASNGPSTRPQLSAALSFSKPTMSAAVTELERHGLVAQAGVSQGALGRSSINYGLGDQAGLVIGVDCGTTQIRAIACSLDNAPVADVEKAINEVSGSERFRTVETVIAETLVKCAQRAAFLRAIVIALPNIISASLERLPEREAFLEVMERLNRRYGVAILLENNVNCAAVAEYHYGAAKEHSFAIYMQIGVKIGVGIVIDGKLFRGFKGGAGEIGHLPFPWSEHEQPKVVHVETYLGSAALMERAASQWPPTEGPAPQNTSELFSHARTSPTAKAIVARHARDIGNLAAACISVLDPELIVLGGGVGQNAVLLPVVKETVEELCWPVDVVVSALSSRATALGAVRLAVDFALARLLGEEAKGAFLYSGAAAT